MDAGRALKASGVRRRHVVNEVAEVNALVWCVRVVLEADHAVPVVVDVLEHVVGVGRDGQPLAERAEADGEMLRRAFVETVDESAKSTERETRMTRVMSLRFRA